MEKNNRLQALYSERNRKIIETIKTKDLTGHYKGFIYALNNDIYPYLDTNNEETSISEIELFNEFYAIKKEFISKVLLLAHELYGKHECLSFYEYEDILGDENRGDLIHIFRYAFLSRRFINWNFWDTLIDHKNNPDEANWITEE